MKHLIIYFFLLSFSFTFGQKEKVTFPSLDGLTITGNLYKVDIEAPIIVLCHQARFNKFEYDGIAERLNGMGYNCLAIDQRSGGPIASQQNETNLAAHKEGKGTDYLDAIPDIKAAINFAQIQFKNQLILWGSSYSSTLVLYESIENEHVDAVVSFSPGNYFAKELGDLTEKLKGFTKPYFITSSKPESEEILKLLKGTSPEEKQIHFIPVGRGNHGSRALWVNQDGGAEYWEAIINFLESIQ